MRVRCIARKLAPRHKKAAPALGLFLFGGDHFSSRLMRGNLMSPDASESSSLFWRPPRRLSNSLSDERCLSSLSSRLVTGGDLDMASGGAPPAGNAEADVGVAAAAGSFADGLLSSMSSSGGRRRDLVVTVGSELTSEPAVAYTVARDVALSAVRRRAARAPTPTRVVSPKRQSIRCAGPARGDLAPSQQWWVARPLSARSALHRVIASPPPGARGVDPRPHGAAGPHAARPAAFARRAKPRAAYRRATAAARRRRAEDGRCLAHVWQRDGDATEDRARALRAGACRAECSRVCRARRERSTASHARRLCLSHNRRCSDCRGCRRRSSRSTP